MPADNDRKYMLRCLGLAYGAEGMTYPNPLVGSVIVNEGKIIGEGYHLKAGMPHAEVLAIESVKDKNLLRTSTLYVNLEPCSHYGKTPPCADFIISHFIPRVVAGSIDTSSKVSGKGFEKLRSAGCEVIVGVAGEECRRINRRFFTFNEKQRPYITLKWAQSADGFIDRERPEGSEPGTYWITGKPERILVHRWRASEQSILAGAGTIRADNPRLDVRDWKGNNPVRVILSGSGLLPEDLAIRSSIGASVIFTFHPEKTNLSGAVPVRLNQREPAAVQICDFLYKWGIQSMLIEGGAIVLNHFITTGYWDEARIFYGEKFFKNGVRAPEIKGKLLSRTKFTESTLEIVLNDVK